jgi:type IV pilus assembly protein PilY1
MLIFKACERVVNMMKTPVGQKLRMGVVTVLMTLGVAHNAYSVPAQKPLFQTNSVKPIMMLNMSKDHQLYFKVYDDYSDLDNDGIPDTTYKNSYDYYGYFDSEKCYLYSTSNNRFEPVAAVSDTGYCNVSVDTQWSGNFLNWASMTRIDSVRKILYGGLRSTDSPTETVLERAFLPHDAHSFAKFYDGDDIGRLTPFKSVPKNQLNTAATGITICNTTPGGTALSQKVTHAPLLRVARGNYTFWASNERWQCRWREDMTNSADGVNGNDQASTGIYAYSDSPTSVDKTSTTTVDENYRLGTGSAAGEYYARVQVCVTGLEETNCYKYPSGNRKPQGLLQEFGEPRNGSTDAKINFGLMTGSYSNNTAGGILRKAVGNLSAEVKATTDGTFTGVNGAINTLNKLRIYGYRYADGTYFGETGSDSCSWALGSFTSGCSNWGNPQAEIYLESLRHLAGKTPNTAFNVTDSSKKDNAKIAGVTEVATWTAPVTAANYCAPLNVLQFNASSTSYDGDDLAKASDIMGSETLNSWTNKVGADYEKLIGDYFVGKTSTDSNELCTAKTIGNLSDVRGTCPDAPRLEGSYHIAGLASYARRNDLIPDTADPITSVKGPQTVRTYGVALSPALPKVTIPVPNSTTGHTVTILPACRNKTITTTSGNGANCAIVDFKVLAQSAPDATTKTGTLYVNWEDSEQGGDYDQDLWGIIKYEVTSTQVKITTDAIAQSSGDKMGFGFVVNGTDNDGFHVLSGINNFTFDDCNNCVVGDSAKSVEYKVGTSNAKLLESPLFYAAKWGGYSDAYIASLKKATKDVGGTYTEATLLAALKEIKNPNTYYFATDPRKLAASLSEAFKDIAAGIGAASSVATVSARVSAGSLVYQAQFNSENWTGNLLAYEFDKAGGIVATPKYCTSDIIIEGKKECTGQMATNSSTRTLYISNGSELKSLEWGNLTQLQKDGLRLLAEATIAPDTTEITYANAKKRLDWLAGNATYEEATTGGILRNRGTEANRNILGDIVNSSPVHVGDRNFRYESLPGDAGAKYKAFLADKKKPTMPTYIIVGSNDGMVHAFDANTLAEKFAFIPSNSFLRKENTDEGTKLTNLSSPTYGKVPGNPHTYNVDGPITYSDVYITVDKVASTKAWRRVVVGTFGAGGRSIYALDVTGATPTLLFELNEADYPELGYVIGKPIIAPMKNGRWAAIFGNGSDSTKASHLFVVDIEDPKSSTLTRVISAGEGTGLSAPSVLLDGVGRAVTAYAGDIDGNLWRFDLNNADPKDWVMDYKLFKALATGSTAAEPKPQPITGAPTLGVNAKKDFKTMVYFGTGKYYDDDDSSTNIPAQSFYAILDTGAEVARSTLLQKTITTTGITSRTVSTANPNWDAQNGWYLDFNYSGAPGERVTTKPLLLFDKLIFPTLIPTASQCDAGGGSWLMEVVAVGDKYINQHVLDPNVYDSALVVGNVNFVSVIDGGGVIVKNNSSGEIKGVKTTGEKALEGRESWRQIQ